MAWHTSYNKVCPHVFKVSTPAGDGTGFYFASSADRSVVAIATALHVVEQADNWQEPIRLLQHTTKDMAFVRAEDRAIIVDRTRDSAAIVVSANLFHLGEPPPLQAKDKFRKVGTALGWAGYPAVAPSELCFFSGGVSAFIQENDSYLIDGVAINGVSGGPVFTDAENDESPTLVGLISAYLPNRQSMGTLPGLLKAFDLTHLHSVIDRIRSLDDARAKAQEAQKERQEAPAPPAQGPSEPGTTGTPGQQA